MAAFAFEKSSVQQSDSQYQKQPVDIDPDIIAQLVDKHTRISRQDLTMLSLLKNHGLNIVEIKITSLSSSVGQFVSNFKIPPRSRILYVLRNNQPIIKLDLAFLKAGDSVFLLTEDASLTQNLLIA